MIGSWLKLVPGNGFCSARQFAGHSPVPGSASLLHLHLDTLTISRDVGIDENRDAPRPLCARHLRAAGVTAVFSISRLSGNGWDRGFTRRPQNGPQWRAWSINPRAINYLLFRNFLLLPVIFPFGIRSSCPMAPCTTVPADRRLSWHSAVPLIIGLSLLGWAIVMIFCGQL